MKHAYVDLKSEHQEQEQQKNETVKTKKAPLWEGPNERSLRNNTTAAWQAI